MFSMLFMNPIWDSKLVHIKFWNCQSNLSLVSPSWTNIYLQHSVHNSLKNFNTYWVWFRLGILLLSCPFVPAVYHIDSGDHILPLVPLRNIASSLFNVFDFQLRAVHWLSTSTYEYQWLGFTVAVYRVWARILKWGVQNAIFMKMRCPVPIFSIVKSQILGCPKS